MNIRLPGKAELAEGRACRAYGSGDPASLATMVRNNQVTLKSTREFIASIIDGTAKKKPRGRRPDPEEKTLGRNFLIQRDYHNAKMVAASLITVERFQAAIKARLIPRDTLLPLFDDEGNPIPLPTLKGWKNTGGSVKERALKAVGKRHRLSPERISEIVYPGKRRKL